MKLLELYENLFQYMCRLNRASKTPAHPEYMRVRTEIKEMFSEAERGASGDDHANRKDARMRMFQRLLHSGHDLGKRPSVSVVYGASFHEGRFRFLAMGRNRPGRSGDFFSHRPNTSGVETPG